MPMIDSDYPQPRIIPRSEHAISRANIDREALKVMYRLRDEGFLAYLVGGGVRDLLQGKTPKDFDISTNAKPGELRKIFRNSRIIGRRFRLVQVFYHGGKIIEVSTFRCRSEFEENGNGEVETLAADNTFGNPAEDAFRRDLTINALFYEIENFTIIDYVGGMEDIQNRVVRMVGDPERRVIRDPVRMMRAIRHAARSNFTIEPITWRAIRQHADKLALCPDSRLRDELFKDLRAGASRAWAELALAGGVLLELLPFYRGILPDPDPVDLAQQQVTAANPAAILLFKLLILVDRLAAEERQLGEEALLAMLLLPWADSRFGLLAQQLDRAGAYQLSRALRAELDDILQPLNIKRGNKEGVTQLLACLPIFLRHQGDEHWPKSLRGKGYFAAGLAFFNLYQAALADEVAVRELGEEALAPVAATTVAMLESSGRRRPRSGNGRREGRAPSFSSRKGGIFGLK